MPQELLALSAACGLGVLHLILAAHSASIQRGYLWTASARDASRPPLSGLAGRLDRASRNFLETFPFFAVGVLILALLGETGPATAGAAWTYLGARAAFLVVYAAGVFLLRSLIWNVATFSILFILLAPHLEAV